MTMAKFKSPVDKPAKRKYIDVKELNLKRDIKKDQ